MPPPAPTAALLLHAQPNGGWHVDWLLQARPPAGPDDRAAVGWRVPASPSQPRPDQMQPGQTVEAEPLPPHRALYLNLRQPTVLTGDRGTVTPLAWGWLDSAAGAPAAAATHAAPLDAPLAGRHAAPLAPPHTFTIRWHHGATLTYRTHAAPNAANAAAASGTAAAAAPTPRPHSAHRVHRPQRMTTTISILASVMFVVIGLVGVLLQAVTLPGIWLIVLGAVLYQGICTLAGQPLPFEWWTLIAALVLGVLGEVVELITCAIGAAAAGGSKRGAAGAILGSVVGALAGIFVFAFIPIIGPLIGALLGAAAGALAGELSYGDRTFRQAWLPAVGAAVGRVAGAVAKFGLACVIFLMLAIDAFV